VVAKVTIHPRHQQISQNDTSAGPAASLKLSARAALGMESHSIFHRNFMHREMTIAIGLRGGADKSSRFFLQVFFGHPVLGPRILKRRTGARQIPGAAQKVASRAPEASQLRVIAILCS